MKLWLEQKKGSKCRPAKMPDLGKKLHERFFELWGLGKKIRRAWFLVEGQKLYRERYPGRVYTDPITQIKRYYCIWQSCY